MNQNLFIYFLLKTQLIKAEKNDLIQLYTKEKDYLNTFLSNVITVIYNDDFIYLDESIPNKLYEFISEIKFDYLKDKEINNKINIILRYLLIYKAKPENEKKLIEFNYMNSEACARQMSLTKEELINLTEADYYVYHDINQDEYEYSSQDMFSALSTINYLISSYPNLILEDQEEQERYYKILNIVEETLINSKEEYQTKEEKQAYIYFKKYRKRTEKRLNKLVNNNKKKIK